MSEMGKFLIRSISYIGAFLLLLLVLIILPTSRNFLISFSITHYCRAYGIDVSYSKFLISGRSVKITDIEIKYRSDTIRFSGFKGRYSLVNLLLKGRTEIALLASDVDINGGIIFNYSSNGLYYSTPRKLSITQAAYTTYVKSNTPNINFLRLDSEFEITKNYLDIQKLDLQIDDGMSQMSGRLGFKNSSIDRIKINSTIKDIPLQIYEIFLAPKNPVHEFLDYSISSGNISSGEVKIDVDDEATEKHSDITSKFTDLITPENIKADFIIDDVEYKYDHSAPATTIKKLPLKLRGSIIEIDLKNANIAEHVIKTGNIVFNYLSENVEYLITASLEGRAEGLTRFLDKATIDTLKTNDIDIEKISGHSKADVRIMIPTAEGSEMVFDIHAKIAEAKLNLLGDYIQCENYQLEGIFDGKKIEINGKGIANKLDSDIKLYVNIYEDNDVICTIDSNILLTQGNATLPVHFKDGSSSLRVHYGLDKNMKSNLSVQSDLSNLHFFIPTISLDKPRGKKASLAISTSANQSDDTQNYAFKLLGDDDLNISGTLRSSDNEKAITFNQVKYLNNEFKAEILRNPHQTIIEIQGGLLDLSEENFETLLNQQESGTSNIKIRAVLDTIKMKNNVSLTGFMADIEYLNNQWVVAKLFSNIDDKDFIIFEYDNKKNTYMLETNEVGKLFSAINFSDKIKEGTLSLVMNTQFDSSKKINQYNGKFIINKLLMSNNKFLTRMVSFISIPGLLNSLGNNPVPFSTITGDVMINNTTNILKVQNIKADGPYFGFYANVGIDTSQKTVKVSGGVIPSLYGLNRLVGGFPLLKYFLGNKGSIVTTPFSYEDKY